MNPKKKHPKVKSKLHPNNKHNGRYDFKLLINTLPALKPFVRLNDYGDESIDFFNPEAVLLLNKALLKHYYGVLNWSIPKNYLCPPIPGRADYIHHIAQLLGESNYGKTPKGSGIKCLDIGVGANCIYPIIGIKEYGWSFLASDIDQIGIENATAILNENPFLKGKLEIKLQQNAKDVFYGIIKKEDIVDVSICNPPFHASEAEANAGTMRKLKNLKGEKIKQPTKNFGGQHTELWCDGGENKFVRNMIRESKKFANTCFWFTTLISKQSNLKGIYNALESEGAATVKTIEMGQGNKTSRIVAWTFLSKEHQKNWREKRWTGTQ